MSKNQTEEIECKSEHYTIEDDFGNQDNPINGNSLFGELFAPSVRLIEDIEVTKLHYIKILYLSNENTVVDKVSIQSFETHQDVISIPETNLNLTQKHKLFKICIQLKNKVDGAHPGKNVISQVIISEESHNSLKKLFGNKYAVLETVIDPVEGVSNFSRSPGDPIDPYPPFMP
ncbi:hypothetical protein [uncultured Algibacter sp.]|uniref:hypothetical protein n=1 Tax=uncultured Algibacter sp. TaxID=298659 RepID=UPI00261979FA|nr:hypothetical protein [uncultured Algibacter sp.]